jgi:myo-inositol-1(or 4)-monophosphatase
MYFFFFFVTKELGKSLVIAEFGTNRDPQKMESVLKNITALMNKVHG